VLGYVLGDFFPQKSSGHPDPGSYTSGWECLGATFRALGPPKATPTLKIKSFLEIQHLRQIFMPTFFFEKRRNVKGVFDAEQKQ
jgi:hypothetical protein